MVNIARSKDTGNPWTIAQWKGPVYLNQVIARTSMSAFQNHIRVQFQTATFIQGYCDEVVANKVGRCRRTNAGSSRHYRRWCTVYRVVYIAGAAGSDGLDGSILVINRQGSGPRAAAYLVLQGRAWRALRTARRRNDAARD